MRKLSVQLLEVIVPRQLSRKFLFIPVNKLKNTISIAVTSSVEGLIPLSEHISLPATKYHILSFQQNTTTQTNI